MIFTTKWLIHRQNIKMSKGKEVLSETLNYNFQQILVPIPLNRNIIHSHFLLKSIKGRNCGRFETKSSLFMVREKSVVTLDTKS
jgi:hypothetical protein